MRKKKDEGRKGERESERVRKRKGTSVAYLLPMYTNHVYIIAFGSLASTS